MFNPIKGDLSPENAIPKAFECAGQSFGSDGHLHTTFKVAIYAGVDIDKSKVMAYFSQYPDIDHKYNAVYLWLNVKYLLGDNRKWKHYIFNNLHSLHGGDSDAIKLRKNQLGKLIKQLIDKEEFWRAGVLIHALGDAYAHTKNKLNSSNEEAYGETIGHGFDSFFKRNPDDIDRKVVREKYVAYIKHLYSILKTEDSKDDEFELFCSSIDVDLCVDEACPSIKIESESSEEELGVFEKCMNKNLRNLTRDEVSSLLDKI